jgi:CRP-like cAMP-binding protein
MTAEPLFTALARFEAFRQVPAAALQASLPLWQAAQLKSGRMMWKQGRPADALAVVVSGSLDVMVNGTRIRQVKAPALVGESALFITGSRRDASLSAAEPTVVMLLPSAGLRELRAQASPVYAAILDHALISEMRSIQELYRQIAQVRQGNFAAPPTREPDRLLTRLWQRLRPPPPPDASGRAPLATLLALQPVLAAQPEVCAPLAAVFTARHFRSGEVLAREGDEDTRAFVLAEGRVDALRVIEERGSALLVGRFERGAIIGAQALIEGGLRPATLVATTDVWVYHIDQAGHRGLPPAVRTPWLETILAVLTAQCQAASEALQTTVAAFSTQNEEAMPSLIMQKPVRADGSVGFGHPADSLVSVPPKRRR